MMHRPANGTKAQSLRAQPWIFERMEGALLGLVTPLQGGWSPVESSLVLRQYLSGSHGLCLWRVGCRWGACQEGGQWVALGLSCSVGAL